MLLLDPPGSPPPSGQICDDVGEVEGVLLGDVATEVEVRMVLHLNSKPLDFTLYFNSCECFSKAVFNKSAISSGDLEDEVSTLNMLALQLFTPNALKFPFAPALA